MSSGFLSSLENKNASNPCLSISSAFLKVALGPPYVRLRVSSLALRGIETKMKGVVVMRLRVFEKIGNMSEDAAQH
jgi:hypothetical protein